MNRQLPIAPNAPNAPPPHVAVQKPDRKPDRPPWMVFADPQQMFETFFGRDSGVDPKQLERIAVPFREEQELGKATVSALLDELQRRHVRAVSRGKEVQYLHDLVQTIRPHTQLDRRYRAIQIYYVDSDICDARSFPGGTLFFRGLLETAEDEAAVAGIVGHELSHLDRGHHLTRIRRLKSTQQSFTGNRSGVTPDQFLVAGTQMFRLWMRPFQPEAETEADLDGARWAYQAGYDPREMAKLLAAAHEKRPLRIPIPEFLQSHPAADKRSRAILELYDRLQRDAPNPELYLGAENLRRKVAWKNRRFDE